MKENKSKFRERLLQLIKTVTVSVSCVALVGCLTGASTSAKRGMSNAALFGAISASSLGNSTASAQQTARANQQTSYDLDGITSAQTEYYEPEPLGAFGVNKYHPDSLANPYGAGSRYKADGLMNPYSEYGSRYSNKSWTNPYATDAPKLYDSEGTYLGKLSANKYDPESVSNPYGQYGSKFSPTSIKNPYGAGNPYNQQPVYVVPSP